MRDNSPKLKQEKFRLGMKKIVFPRKTVGQRLLREVM